MLETLKTLRERATWTGFVAVCIAGTFCLSIWIFAELVDDALGGDYLVQEEQIMRAFRHADDLAKPLGPPWLVDAARDMSAMGGALVLALLTLFVVIFELLRGRRRAALLLAVATLGGLALSTGLKHGFHRERPHAVPHLTTETSASFPSGHSMLSSVVYLTLGSLVARTLKQRRLKIFLVSIAFFVAFLIGVSRVYLGVHYPTDVIAGWTAGTAWALLCWTVVSWLQGSTSEHEASQTHEPQASR